MENRNLIQCMICKDIIYSSHRHDMKWCTCGAIAIDGGNDYCKITGNFNNVYCIKEKKILKQILEENSLKYYKTNDCKRAYINNLKEEGVKISGNIIFAPLKGVTENQKQYIDVLVEYHGFGYQSNLTN